MSDSRRSSCKLCGNFILWDTCGCRPFTYEIKDFNDGAPDEIWCRGEFSMVAEAAVERMDCENEYLVLQGRDATVVVTDSDGVSKTFRVWGESRPHYYAVPV